MKRIYWRIFRHIAALRILTTNTCLTVAGEEADNAKRISRAIGCADELIKQLKQ